MPGQALPQYFDLALDPGVKRAEGFSGVYDELRRQFENENIRISQSAIATLSAAATRYERAIDKIAQGICFFDSEQRLTFCNRRFADIYRLQQEDVSVGKTLRQIVERRYAVGAGPGMGLEEYLSLSAAIGRGDAPDTWTTELSDGRTVLICHQPLPEGGWVSTHEDVTERKLATVLHEEQAHILEMIASSAPLEHVLDHLMRLIELQLTGIFGSVLLLDKEGLRLRHGAAPSLPSAYTKAIDGVSIGPNVGSCGAAAYRREPVTVCDIAIDPLWADYRELAAAHGLRSCWSTPIISHRGAVLGTFAMYSKEVRDPAPPKRIS